MSESKKSKSREKGQRANLTQMSMHSLRNMLGSPNELSLFSERGSDLKKDRQSLEGVDRFGFNLTDIQFRVLEGILNAFSKTNYRGNISPIEKEDVYDERHSLDEFAYKYVHEIPRIRATQQEILKWSGFSGNSMGDRERVAAALTHLAKTPYCFYYQRLAYEDNGNPRRSSTGQLQKESITAIDTLFAIKEVKSESSDRLLYYEITPSLVFLDQRENYFMLIPFDWREEVLEASGKKKISVYTLRFLYFLRYQYELRRRNPKQPKPYELRRDPEDIAYSLKMPASMIKKKKKQMLKILSESYEIAKKLGYLLEYDQSDIVDRLVLNDEKYEYSSSGKGIEEQQRCPDSPAPKQQGFGKASEAEKLFFFFHDQIRKVDSSHPYPTSGSKTRQLKIFSELLREKGKDQIIQLLEWSHGRSYWHAKLCTPSKLQKNFQEALLEMNANKNSSSQSLAEINRILAKKLKDTYCCPDPGMEIDLLNTVLEIRDTKGGYCSLAYADKDFKVKLDRELSKRAISADLE